MTGFSQRVVVLVFVLTFVVIFAILFLQALAIHPWGNFPLNDDWGHALLTQQWAKTGHFSAFIPITPSLVLQAFCGKIFVQLFGFSHAVLRLTNILAVASFSFLFDRILVGLSVRREWRLVAAVVWLCNPLVTLLTFSFMSDDFGLLFAYLGVAVWFAHLRLEIKEGWTTRARILAIVSAATMGFSFWTRQLSILVFGGAALGRLCLAARDRGWAGIAATVRNYLPASASFLLPIFGYLFWARHSSNLNVDFTSKFHLIAIGRLGEPLLQIVVWILYQTAFALPILLLLATRARWRLTRWTFLLIAVALCNTYFGNQNYDLKASLHAVFPILGNDLNPYGVGPITLTDVYINNAPEQPAFWRWPWWIFELCLLLALPIWGQVTKRVREVIHGPDRLRREAISFGFCTLFVTWLINSLFFGKGTFDRYVLAAFPAVLIALLATFGTEKINARRKPIFFAALALYVYYGVGGTHDYFRWNEARWNLLAKAEARGINTQDIDGGYEMNAWNHYRNYPVQPEIHCSTQYWFCGNRRYAIAFHRDPVDKILAEEKIVSWLGTYPPLRLLEKKN